MYGTFSGSPANSNLGDHQCKPKGHCKNQINQKEAAASVFSCQIWKSPYVS